MALISKVINSVQNELTNATYGLSAIETLVDDLESRLTATRAGYLDNLSAGAVALQSSVDDLEGRLTAARAGYLDKLNLTGSIQSLKSIQRGTITMNADVSHTATLSPSVDTTKTRLRFLGQSCTVDASTEHARLVLTSSTVVTATRANNSGTTIVSWEIEESY